VVVVVVVEMMMLHTCRHCLETTTMYMASAEV
jgi:hypothetical protein